MLFGISLRIWDGLIIVADVLGEGCAVIFSGELSWICLKSGWFFVFSHSEGIVLNECDII